MTKKEATEMVSLLTGEIPSFFKQLKDDDEVNDQVIINTCYKGLAKKTGIHIYTSVDGYKQIYNSIKEEYNQM